MSKLKRKYGVGARPCARKSRIARRSLRRPKGRDATRNSRAAAPVRRLLDSIKPTPRGKGYEFITRSVGGSIPSKFIPEHGRHPGGIRARCSPDSDGGLRGGAIRRVVSLVDSNEMSFKMAGIQGQDGRAQVSPRAARATDEIDHDTRPIPG